MLQRKLPFQSPHNTVLPLIWSKSWLGDRTFQNPSTVVEKLPEVISCERQFSCDRTSGVQTFTLAVHRLNDYFGTGRCTIDLSCMLV